MIALWILFFATTVYGHAGYKQAFASGASTIWQALFSVWGITATLSWCGSALLWIAILQKSSLISAHTSSALSQVVGSSRVDLQACKLEYSIVSPK